MAGTVACASKPPDDSRDYSAKVAADRAAKDAAFLAGDDPVPKSRHAHLHWRKLPIEPDATGRPHSNRATTDDHRDASLDRHQQENAARRHAEFTLKGQPLRPRH
jgi:hypothetical protein